MEENRSLTVDPFSIFMYNFSPTEKFEITKYFAKQSIKHFHRALLSQNADFEILTHDFPSYPKINLGYISYDFANHPLAQLLASIFSF